MTKIFSTKSVVILMILAVGALIGTSLSATGMVSSEEIPYTHSHTKAVCDNNNYCEDFEIFCKNNNMIGVRSTGFSAQFHENWQDPRSKDTIEKFC